MSTEPEPKTEEKPCNCIEIIRAKLKEHYKSEIDFDMKMVVNTETGKISPALPPLYFTYMDGRKKKKSYVHYPFCPFCGNKRV